MSLDVFVMPLRKFKVGDFTSPIETALGIRPKIVGPDGIEDVPRSAGPWERFRAGREVASICKAVSRANGIKIRWRDEGGTVFSARPGDLDALREFAAGVEGEDFPHLLEHGLADGYFLPVAFDRPVAVEHYKIFGHWDAHRAAASTPRLLSELDRIRERLGDVASTDESDPLRHVKHDYAILRKAAEASAASGLPIVFWS